MTTALGELKETSLLRLGLLGLAGLGVVGATTELLTLRHWKSTVQLVPWVALALIAVLIVTIAIRPSRKTVRLTRFGSIAVLAASGFGVFQHVRANIETGALDRHFGPTWETTSTLRKYWLGASGSVGPSPLLAPGALAQIALCLLLACLYHPVTRPAK